MKLSEEYTLNDAIEHVGFGRFQVKVIIIAGFCWMADAMEMMILSVIGPILKCEWNLSSTQEAFITTIVFIGAGFGSITFGYVADRFGRKKSIIFSALAVLLIGICSSQSPNYLWMLMLRFLVGFGLGGIPQAVTISTEVLPMKTRGKSLFILSVFWALGSVFASTLAIEVLARSSWRWYLIIVTLPGAIFLIMTIWLPESPHYLATTNEQLKLQNLLQQISKENGRDLPQGNLVIPEINASRGNFKELISNAWLKITIILSFIWMVVSLTYFGIVLLPTELFQTGIDGCNPSGGHQGKFLNTTESCHKLTNKDYVDFMITSLAEFPGLIAGFILIDLIGRKKTLSLLLGTSGIVILLLTLCTSRTVNVIIMFIVRAFGNSAIIVAFIYTPEVFPTNIRSIGLGFCVSFSRIGALSTPFIAQVLITQTFYGTIILYAGLLIICGIASLLLPIETKGRTLKACTEQSIVEKKGYEQF